MSKLYIFIFVIFLQGSVFAQSKIGDNPLNIGADAVVEIESKDRGLLIPCIAIPNILERNPIIVPPKDGLMLFNTNQSTKRTLFYWDAQAQAGNGAWSQHLYFKETPKTAVVGLAGNNIAALNNANAGTGTFIGGINSSFTILSSGNMPSLSTGKAGTVNTIDIGAGVYTLEVSLIISAPAPDPGRGEPLQGNFYNMGYFMDFYIEALNGNDFYLSSRVERSVVSPLNEHHRVTFVTAFEVTNTEENSLFRIETVLGRRLGSTHRDLVYIIPNGSYFKLIKLK